MHLTYLASIAIWTVIITPFRGQEGVTTVYKHTYYTVFHPRPFSISMEQTD